MFYYINDRHYKMSQQSLHISEESNEESKTKSAIRR